MRKPRASEAKDAPTYHEIAARLRVDAETLRRFVIDHPNPSVAAVLGFAEAAATHADAVERWLEAREVQVAARHERLVAEYDADDLTTRGSDLFADASEDKPGRAGGEA